MIPINKLIFIKRMINLSFIYYFFLPYVIFFMLFFLHVILLHVIFLHVTFLHVIFLHVIFPSRYFFTCNFSARYFLLFLLYINCEIHPNTSKATAAIEIPGRKSVAEPPASMPPVTGTVSLSFTTFTVSS